MASGPTSTPKGDDATESLDSTSRFRASFVPLKSAVVQPSALARSRCRVSPAVAMTLRSSGARDQGPSPGAASRSSSAVRETYASASTNFEPGCWLNHVPPRVHSKPRSVS